MGAPTKACVGGTKIGVEDDSGWLDVWRDGGRTMVYSHKQLRFDNSVANGISQGVLTYAELARELAEMACCYKTNAP
jgi:hypothetical protein